MHTQRTREHRGRDWSDGSRWREKRTFPNYFERPKTLKGYCKTRKNEVKSLVNIEAKLPNEILLKIIQEEYRTII